MVDLHKQKWQKMNLLFKMHHFLPNIPFLKAYSFFESLLIITGIDAHYAFEITAEGQLIGIAAHHSNLRQRMLLLLK